MSTRTLSISTTSLRDQDRLAFKSALNIWQQATAPAVKWEFLEEAFQACDVLLVDLDDEGVRAETYRSLYPGKMVVAYGKDKARLAESPLALAKPPRGRDMTELLGKLAEELTSPDRTIPSMPALSD